LGKNPFGEKLCGEKLFGEKSLLQFWGNVVWGKDEEPKKKNLIYSEVVARE
jgi:hypothetical protein